MSNVKKYKKILFVLFFLLVIVSIVSMIVLKENNQKFKFYNKKIDVSDAIGRIGELGIQFDLKTANEIVDKYYLNTGRNNNQYYKDMLVSAYGKIPLFETMDINVELLYRTQELYKDLKNKNLNNLIVKKCYVECSDDFCDNEYSSGYDIDFYVNGKTWKNFTGGSANYLIDNAHKYGLIMRYNKKDNYQPWHYRYVGLINAYVMYYENLNIEEFVEKLSENIVYRVKDTNNYFYKTKSEEIYVPKNFKYEISSTNDNYYIVNFSTDTITKLTETDMISKIKKSVDDININMDLQLVNNDYALKYINKDLITVDTDEKLLARDAAVNMRKILEEGNKLDHHVLYITSSFRTFEMQKKIYDTEEKGFAQVPNHSEHQLGLAADLATDEKNIKLFNSSYIGYWVNNNSYNYGYILRYPSIKTNITKINGEEWHYRYVGKLHALFMYEHDLVLEEYLNMFEDDKTYLMNCDNEKFVMYKTKLKNNKIEIYSEKSIVYYLYDDNYLIMTRV